MSAMLEAMMKANLVSPEQAKEAERAKARQAKADRSNKQKAERHELENKLASLEAQVEKLPYNEVGVQLADLHPRSTSPRQRSSSALLHREHAAASAPRR